MTADGLAEHGLGEEKGMQVAEKENIPVLMIVKTDDGFKEFTSSAYAAYVK